MRRKLPLACLSLLALALGLAGTALAGNGGIAPPAESPQAGRIQDLHWLLLGITGAIFVIVEGTLIAFVIRFRNAGRARDLEGPQIRGHTRLELIWTAIPVLILAVIVGVVFYKLPGIKDLPDASASNPKMTVHVEGRQFYWRYTYPNGAVAVNELRLPAGRPVDLVITAPANDVIHSWWIPSLAGKMDAIPGKVNHLRFETPTKIGIFKGQCAEFCGVQHALMLASVQVVAPGDFDAWVSDQLVTGSGLGKQTYEGACSPCHGLNGEGLIGPPLKGNATLADRRQLIELLENGKNEMPPVGRGWNRGQIDRLVTYVQKEFASGG
ncbi:MAG: cytochrome c oxidase subunit II [Actinomycetota bacterium]